MNAERKEHDLARVAEAARALIENIRAVAGEGDETLIADMVEGETDLFDIIDRLLGRIAETQAFVRGIDAQIEDMRARQERFKKRVETDRTLIEQAMMIADLAKIERPCATLSLSNRAPKLIIDTEADIPAEFFKVGDPVLDKKALGAAIKDGQTVPGAHFDNAAPSLTLRVR